MTGSSRAGAGPELAVERHGSGPAVVLLHGQPGSASDWHRVVPLLSEDHTVLVPDRPGYGSTGGAAVGFASNAGAVVGMLDDAGIDSAVVAGHSWGGGVALAAAVNHPERVRGLVLVSSVRPGERLGWDDRLLAAPVAGDLLAAATIGSVGRLLSSSRVRSLIDRHLSGRAREAVHSVAGVTGATTGADVWRSFVTEQRCLFSELGSLEDGLAGIRAPVFVLSGGSDRIVPAAVGTRLAESIPGSVQKVIAGAHHLLPVDHPEEIAAAVRAVEGRAGE